MEPILAVIIGVVITYLIDKPFQEKFAALQTQGMPKEAAWEAARNEKGPAGLTRGQIHDWAIVIVFIICMIALIKVIKTMMNPGSGPS